MKPPPLPKLPPSPTKPAELLREVKGQVRKGKEKLREAANQVKELAEELGDKGTKDTGEKQKSV